MSIIGDDIQVFRLTFILSEVRLCLIRARVGYTTTPHHYRWQQAAVMLPCSWLGTEALIRGWYMSPDGKRKYLRNILENLFIGWSKQTVWLVRLHALIKPNNLVSPIDKHVKRFRKMFPFKGDKSSVPEILFTSRIFVSDLHQHQELLAAPPQVLVHGLRHSVARRPHEWSGAPPGRMVWTIPR